MELAAESWITQIAVCVYCALLLPARSQGVVEVASAADLQTALEDGARHIRITSHLNTTGLAPQIQGQTATPSDPPSSFVFSVERNTQSITGTCAGEPEAQLHLEGDWKPGMCLVHVPEHSGFYIADHVGILWLHRLYVFVTGTQTPRGIRRAVVSEGVSGATSLYLTDVSLETRPDYTNEFEIFLPLFVQAHAEQQLQVLVAGVTVVCNDVNDNTPSTSAPQQWSVASFATGLGDITPRNVSVALVHSSFVSLYAPRSRLIYLSTDLRVERCSFDARPSVQEYEILFDGNGIGARTLYSDDASLDVGSFPDGPAVQRRALAQSGRDQRLAQGKIPFLTLDDPSFVALQSEVSPFPPISPPPPPPPNGTIDVSTADELQAALQAKSRHVRIVEHIDTSAIPPQYMWGGDGEVMFNVFPETASITGACRATPSANLSAAWTSGACVVHVLQGYGFLVFDHSAQALWMSNLYILATGGQPNKPRDAVHIASVRDTTQLYLTDLTVETRPAHQDGIDELAALTVRHSNDSQLQVLVAGVTIVANDINIERQERDEPLVGVVLFPDPTDESMPRNSTWSLLDSNFTSLSALRLGLVFLQGDVRIDKCTFFAEPRTRFGDLIFDGRAQAGERTIYAEDPLSLDLTYSGPEPKTLPLAQSDPAHRRADGKPPFLTLQDPPFLALQSEVLRPPPTPPPPPPPPPPVKVVDVSTAEEFQAALKAKSRHIRLTRHIDTTGAPALYRETSGYRALFDVAPQTASITGACLDEPEATLSEPWAPGACVVHVRQDTGFRIVEHAGPALWLHRLYILATGDLLVDMNRDVVEIYNQQSAARIYMTQLVVEARPSYQFSVLGFQPLYIGNMENGQVQVLAAGSTFVANDENIDADQQPQPLQMLVAFATASATSETGAGMPRNSTLSILNSGFISHPAPRFGLLVFKGDLRVENCSFSATPRTVTSDLYFDGAHETGERSLYSNDFSLDIRSSVNGPEVHQRPLAQSGRAQRVAEGTLPFLALDDAELLALRAEVENTLPPPPAVPSRRPPRSSPPSPPPPASFAQRLAAKSSDKAPVGVVVGAVTAVVVVLVAAIASVWFLHRRCALRPRSVETAEPERQSSTRDAFVCGGSTDNDGSARTTGHGTTVNYYLPRPLSTTQTTSSAGEMPHGSAEQTLPRRSEWIATPHTTVTETLASITYAGTMTAGQAGVDVGKDEVQLLEEVLDRMRNNDIMLGNRWRVLSSNQRKVGGQGLVQYTRDEVREQDCAVKFFFDDETFDREAELYARPSVRDMMAAVVHMQPAVRGMPAWIVLERGSSLSDWAAARKPDLLTSAQVLSQVLERLERLHELGLVHRDIKPGNILWREAARAWTLIDFGCVVDTRECEEAALSFTLPYAAPEVISMLEQGAKVMPVHTSLDIWSIGVVVYELLMKARLFPSGSTAENMKSQLTGREPLPWERSAAPEHRAKLAALGILQRPVLQCLSRDPGARPTAHQLLEMIEHSFSRFSATDIDQDE